MLATSVTPSVQNRLEALRTEFADLAFELERKGRRDAADVVMQIDRRVREITEEMAAEGAVETTSRTETTMPMENLS